MVRFGVPMIEDDIMPIHTDIDTMEESSRGIPFIGG
jgi:hypothetical protein